MENEVSEDISSDARKKEDAAGDSAVLVRLTCGHRAVTFERKIQGPLQCAICDKVVGIEYWEK